MSDIKYIYFDLRVKGEPARLLLAHGGVKYTDERIELGWNDPKPWTELKPTMPWLGANYLCCNGMGNPSANPWQFAGQESLT